MNAVAVIPARGGSKRVPRKNIRGFRGKPMIAWPLLAIAESRLFDRVIVSTDDEEIASVARQHGAETPFKRPAEYANDHVGTTAAVYHALEYLREHGGLPAYVCCVYATAAFLQTEALREGYALVTQDGVRGSFAVATFAHPIQRAWRQNEQGELELIWPEHKRTRSQDLALAYHDAGQFYWADVETFLQHRTFTFPPVKPVVIPHHLVHDIDTEEDWRRAELMHEALFGRRHA